MRSVLVAILFAGLIAVAAADPFSLCGTPNDDLQVTSLNVNPSPPVKGQNVTVHVVGNLKKTITSGTIEVNVYFLGIKIFSKDLPLCSTIAQEGDQCPIQAGTFDKSVTEVFPSNIPPGHYTGKVTVTDQDNQQITCVQFDIKSVSSPEDVASLETLALNDDIIRLVNSDPSSTWKAGHNEKFHGMTRREARRFLGTHLDARPSAHVSRVILHASSIPDSFDARQKWSNCVFPVRDQQQCGSCWAFGCAEALTDRFCIASQGSVKVVMSPEDLVSCDSGNYGCNGGYLNVAWEYVQSNGVVADSCFPYTAGGGVAPACRKTCVDGSTPTRYSIESGSIVQPGDVASIQTEIMTNGPVEAAFSVYQDFFSYKSGVYSHKSGSLDGGHAIKVLGWGVDGSTPYWIVQNSWGTSWGMNGFFWILRGSNECGIESNVIAGSPKL